MQKLNSRKITHTTNFKNISVSSEKVVYRRSLYVNGKTLRWFHVLISHFAANYRHVEKPMKLQAVSTI